jgi:hypothetical protein
MKATDLLSALEAALGEYKRTNNPLTFISCLRDVGYQVVLVDEPRIEIEEPASPSMIERAKVQDSNSWSR